MSDPKRWAKTKMGIEDEQQSREERDDREASVDNSVTEDEAVEFASGASEDEDDLDEDDKAFLAG